MECFFFFQNVCYLSYFFLSISTNEYFISFFSINKVQNIIYIFKYNHILSITNIIQVLYIIICCVFKSRENNKSIRFIIVNVIQNIISTSFIFTWCTNNQNIKSFFFKNSFQGIYIISFSRNYFIIILVDFYSSTFNRFKCF